MRPLECGTEGARVEQVGRDHFDSTRCQRPPSVAGGIAAGNAHRELPRADERVHDATTLQTCTTEYRYHLLGHHRLRVPDASRSGAQGRAAPARRSLDPKTILLICVQGHILAPGRDIKDLDEK